MVISIFLCFTIRFFFPSLTVFSEKLVFRYGANCILLKSQHLQWVILEVSFRSHHSAVQISLAQFNLSPHELCQLLCTQLEQVIPIRVGETPLPTADAHRNLWMLWAQRFWDVHFHLFPTAVNGSCVNAERLVSETLCAFELTSTVIHSKMLAGAFFCYTRIARSAISQQTWFQTIWVSTNVTESSRSTDFSVGLWRWFSQGFCPSSSYVKQEDLTRPLISRRSFHHAKPLVIH